MYLEDEYLVVIIDSDNAINCRYKRMDWKDYLLEDYKRYEKNLNENNSYLQIHLTKDYINYLVRRNNDVFYLTPNVLKRRTAVENYYVKNNAFELMKSKLNVVGKRKLIGYFPIKKFVYEEGRYLIKIQIKEYNKIILEDECKVCFENNKYVRGNGYFKCGHNIICDDCFHLLSNKCCPYCRSI